LTKGCEARDMWFIHLFLRVSAKQVWVNRKVERS